MSIADGTSTYLNHEPTYHNNKDAAYVLPNDSQEHVRLEEQARHLSAIMGNQIIHAPLKTDIKDARMLDVGCGTGIVTDHLGTRFPHAEVYGLDLSAVPQLRTRPPNVTFLQGNIVTDNPSQWLSPGSTSPFRDGQDSSLFDLIFSRLLVCGLTNWPSYINKSFQLLKTRWLPRNPRHRLDMVQQLRSSYLRFMEMAHSLSNCRRSTRDGHCTLCFQSQTSYGGSWVHGYCCEGVSLANRWCLGERSGMERFWRVCG
ncbi:Secondary metabolism regulator LAE1 [Pseudocercospora fuligena]|uniref:Secondary metabolism regulator LAE1 n=1 Tax=Pseudocercospora fuligena TaxID=685502 RepID=A0A8H6VBQ7_9PEZI|nr:Secondary metabolism regulator LAE1 [Pseudocercospora fuligena]